MDPFLKDYPFLFNSLGKFLKDRPIKYFVEKYLRKIIDLRDFLREFRILKKLNQKNKLNDFKKRVNDEEFMKCIAAYYSILYSHFYIDGNSLEDQIIFQDWSQQKVQLNNEDWIDNFSQDKVYLPDCGQIFSYDEKLLKNIINNKLKRNFSSEKLNIAIDWFNKPSLN